MWNVTVGQPMIFVKFMDFSVRNALLGSYRIMPSMHFTSETFFLWSILALLWLFHFLRESNGTDQET